MLCPCRGTGSGTPSETPLVLVHCLEPEQAMALEGTDERESSVQAAVHHGWPERSIAECGAPNTARRTCQPARIDYGFSLPSFGAVGARFAICRTSAVSVYGQFVLSRSRRIRVGKS